jgi:Ca-activated chloride channel homolog
MKTHPFLRSSLILLFIFFVSAMAAQVVLRGRLMDSVSNSPLSKQIIVLKSKEGKTWQSISDSAGKFIFKSLVAGPYEMQIHATHYLPYKKIVQVSAAATAVTVKLKRSAAFTETRDHKELLVGLPTKTKAMRVSEQEALSCAPTNYHYNYPPAVDYSRENYHRIEDNGYKDPSRHPLSTLSIDVDRASYSNVRRFLNNRQLPPADAVRVEEFINYFPYDYPAPKNGEAFSITRQLSDCPWNQRHQLIRIGIKGKEIEVKNMKTNNLVFLVDVSGSMSSADKLPLLKSGLRLLVDQMRSQDRISLVAYAGAAGLVLPPTDGTHKEEIIAAIERLESGGSTAGGAGIALAYKVAREHFLQEGNNRIILATDGDFNVGVSSEGELVRMIEKERSSGVYLTVLGFGTGNINDAMMEQLADKGNGNYAYIDNLLEAKKVLVRM